MKKLKFILMVLITAALLLSGPAMAQAEKVLKVVIYLN